MRAMEFGSVLIIMRHKPTLRRGEGINFFRLGVASEWELASGVGVRELGELTGDSWAQKVDGSATPKGVGFGTVLDV